MPARLRPHLEKDADSLFELCGRIIDEFAGLFGEPYPFDKSDHVFVPEFNWGGMENVANITYTDSVVFREPATADQVRRRAEYFAHELAHMWFGDLVTMKWWEDVWLNESFASYVAYLALDSIGDDDIWQDFNFRMKLWAYREDQRPTTHRIADSVGSTDETFLNFDGITYGKGASALKQLVRAIGLDAFRDGLRTYFRRHRFGNATLVDFLAALQEGSGVDLVGWAARWLKTPSLNTISVRLTATGDTITKLELHQSASEEHPYLRPHHLDLALISSTGTVRSVPAVIEDVSASVPAAEGGAVPAFVYPNLGDHGYAKFTLDEASVAYAAEHLGSLGDGLLRQQVWASLYEMVRDGALTSLRYLELVDRHLPAETSLPVVDMVTATVAGVIGRFVPEERLNASASAFVATATRAIAAAPPGDAGVLWARALIAVAITPEDATAAAQLVDRPPTGLAVDQDMRWSVAVRWASLGMEGSDARLAAERERDPSDRGERMMVTAHAAKPDPAIKQEVWARAHGDGYESLFVMRAAGNGFWWRSQRAWSTRSSHRSLQGSQTCSRNWRWRQRAPTSAHFSPATASTTTCGVVLLVFSRGGHRPGAAADARRRGRRVASRHCGPRGCRRSWLFRGQRADVFKLLKPERRYRLDGGRLRAIAVRAAMKSRSGIGKRSVVNPVMYEVSVPANSGASGM